MCSHVQQATVFETACLLLSIWNGGDQVMIPVAAYVVKRRRQVCPAVAPENA